MRKVANVLMSKKTINIILISFILGAITILCLGFIRYYEGKNKILSGKEVSFCHNMMWSDMKSYLEMPEGDKLSVMERLDLRKDSRERWESTLLKSKSYLGVVLIIIGIGIMSAVILIKMLFVNGCKR